jgi:anaerobic dimethyl sulfoxide reductase subunit B (iron-sulfur subunit)
MEQRAFYQNMNECTGCRCCQVACKDKNDLDVGYLFRKVTDFEGNEYPDVWSASLSMACNHCDAPVCVDNCPQGALYKEEKYGLVLQDHDLCIGCQTCVKVCPYDAPVYFPEEEKVRKCDGCIAWLENGMLPACVGACSTRCLNFGVEDDIAMEHPDAVHDLSVLPSSEETEPNFYILPKAELV